jgi:hypothetical protein
MSTISLAARVAWLDMADTGQDVVYATALPEGPPLVLGGTAGLIFVSAVDGGTEDDVVQRVAASAGLDPADVRPDVLAFLDHLVSRGLLVRLG